MTCQCVCPLRKKWDPRYIKQIAPDLWPGNGAAQLNMPVRAASWTRWGYKPESTEVKPDFYISVSSIDAHCTDFLSAYNGLKASLPCKHPATPAYSERGIVNFVKHSGIQEFSAKLIKHTGPAASSSSAAAASWNTPQVYQRWTFALMLSVKSYRDTGMMKDLWIVEWRLSCKNGLF